MQIGSVAHRDLFVDTFFEGHRRYEPAELDWPELSSEHLELLRGLPFWTHAREFESAAGPMICAVANELTDKRIREAFELQAYEESRHAGLVDHMIDLYDLPAEPYKPEVVPNPLAEYIHFGFEECLDSFGAFGLFALARQSEILPDPIFEIFDNVMREEAQHIVFFINWYAHHQATQGALQRWLRVPKSLWHYGRAVLQIADLVRDDDADEGADFIVTGAQAFVDDLTPRLVIETCLAENQRRLADFDRRLLVPRFIPALARTAGNVLKFVPGSLGAAPRPPQKTETPRAA
ncbi:MAG: ferritin-like domain-containing protein [Myxococcota bacterium]